MIVNYENSGGYYIGFDNVKSLLSEGGPVQGEDSGEFNTIGLFKLRYGDFDMMWNTSMNLGKNWVVRSVYGSSDAMYKKHTQDVYLYYGDSDYTYNYEH